ncbi:LysE family translocator [Marinobacterium mangrovicola]|uniref:Threonine/homoserine/homoserine lactone efflux protein n=1 Tax=Marinobacterium mangrovicola TaxID=1476959 RepID=A0A4R1GK12_9GAMM|nr:LysE family translocator [Marinobacterium mangrovicola]TCK08654.1 threonine/homoserine/homoserine lactone efflux protein [Marinobacterium mangrovicola]
MISIEFLLTSLVVVLIPGTGVIYTVATGIFVGKRASIFAAFGCTLGIVPALLASAFGLAAIFHASALAFQVVKYTGALYLIYLAWQMWRFSSPLCLKDNKAGGRYTDIVVKGCLINILNPKLSIFFLAFLPQFISSKTDSALVGMMVLGLVFMVMTFAVFIVYGVLSGIFSHFIVKSKIASSVMHRIFATSFAALGLKLAFSDRV